MCSTFPERKQKKKRWRRPSSPTMTNITGWHTAMSTTSRCRRHRTKYSIPGDSGQQDPERNRLRIHMGVPDFIKRNFPHLQGKAGTNFPGHHAGGAGQSGRAFRGGLLHRHRSDKCHGNPFLGGQNGHTTSLL